MAAQSDHRPARHRFALVPSRLLGNLGIWLMSPLARRAPQDQWRGPRAYSPNEPRELLWGAPRIHGELLKLDSLSRKPQCPVTCRDGVIRPPRGGAPSCGTKHLRSVRSVSAKQVGYQTSSADGSCELPARHQGAGWHPLQAYRAIVDLASVVAISLFQSCG